MSLSLPVPPAASRIPQTNVVHGDTRVDDYFWLRDKEKAEVTTYLTAENAYTDALMQPTESFQKTLYDEMLARIQETDLSVPYRQDGYWYYSRTEAGKQYSIQCRKPGSIASPDEQLVLDQNALAEGHPFFSLGASAVSDDGNFLAYTTDVTGFREYTLRVKDLRTGEMLPDVIEKVSSVVWASDNQSVFYSVEDAAKRPYRVYRHQIGSGDNIGDVLVYEEADALYRAFAYRTRDKALIFIGSAASTSTELHFLRSDSPTASLTTIAAREPEHEYYADHRDGLLYIRTNQNALNFRLVTAPVTTPGKNNWTELIPHRPEVPLDDHDLFARHLVLSERVEGLPNLRIRDLETGEEHGIAFPEPTYGVSVDVNREFDTDTLRFRYASLITPPSIFDYEMNTRERTLLKETPVLGGYDRTQYVSERLFATASDGTRIPISLIYKKGLVRDGSAPLLLYGYGSYGFPLPVSFSSNRLSLLDRGAAIALAHIRGGGELGKPWHDAGKMQQKKTTFTDFIACAEHLIAEKFTSPERLAIQGGSAGGLLMGAVVNMRPDLFHAVLSQVPFVDVINTMLDDTLPLTVGEYLEWGNPNEKADYEYMKTYCPYTNLEAKSYPTMLVKTSLNDSQVMYWEPAKYVAKLRTLKTDTNPLLLKTNMSAGHGGASGRYDALKENAFDYAFLLHQWGLAD